MAAKPNQPTKKPRLRSITVITAIILLAIGGFLLFRHHQNTQAIAKERAQYAQAEKDLDALTAQIIAKFGQPVSNSEDKSCGYTSSFNEFAAHGDLYCSVNNNIVYSQASKDEANNTVNLISNEIKKSTSFNYGSYSTALANTLVTPIQLRSESIKDAGGLKCSVLYTYFLSTDKDQVHVDSPAGLELSMSCGSRPAEAAHYPINGS
jgi:hypothetical protein